MSKNFFQRLIAIVLILIVLILAVPSIFKDTIVILFSIILFFSTFDFRKKKKEE